MSVVPTPETNGHGPWEIAPDTTNEAFMFGGSRSVAVTSDVSPTSMLAGSALNVALGVGVSVGVGTGVSVGVAVGVTTVIVMLATT